MLRQSKTIGDYRKTSLLAKLPGGRDGCIQREAIDPNCKAFHGWAIPFSLRRNCDPRRGHHRRLADINRFAPLPADVVVGRPSLVDRVGYPLHHA